MKKPLVLLVFVVLQIGTHGQDMLGKEKAIEKFKDEYLASEVKESREIKWRGKEEKCDEGTISIKVLQKALMRINYFRTLCGLKPVKFTDANNKEAQRAAFIIYVNKRLSHYPEKSWKCYSDEALLAASHSSLGNTDFIYYPEIAFITGFIEDPGESNEAVGHRRSLLFSRADFMGYGATPKTEAVNNSVNRVNEGDSTLLPKYFSYPAVGYNEIDLIFPRWSFSIPNVYDVDFGKCTIEVNDETGKKINVRMLPLWKIYDPTLVWEITDKLKRDYYLNHTITVTIKNVLVNGSFRNYQYNVSFFDWQSSQSRR